MNSRLFVWLMSVEAFLSVLALGAVLFFVDPETSGIFGKLFFYGSVFLFVSGVCAIALSLIRRGGETVGKFRGQLGVSFREGVLLGILTVTMLILQSFRVLVWWVAVLVGIFFLFLEVVFLLRSRKD